ncbi:F-box/LRR-repeat protein 17 [Arachis duranensis]|uniref:F-box/LRR-repeat protein 17 n=1 Tax=Arachis duranensis TaxID=130453 RepID=A0A6P4CBM9_ARADU|nr:F-box/LRR-repeat protein 17 [Arachis duranensis]
MHHSHPKVAAPPPPDASGGAVDISDGKRGKKRGNYNCGRCGQPKKGHVCNVKTPISAAVTAVATAISTDSSHYAVSASSSASALRKAAPSRLRRALSFDDFDDGGAAISSGGIDASEMEDRTVGDSFADADDDLDLKMDLDLDLDSCGLPASLRWEVLRRLPPVGLLAAAQVSKGWRETAKRLWKAAEELRLRVPANVHVGFVASMLQKCPGIVRLSLRMESDFDSTMLACIAFSCSNLEYMEVSMSDGATNRINGGELGRFVADKRSLKCLKMEGCSNLGGFVLCSASLSTLWLSDLHSLSKMVFNCPQLREISLEFSRQENDSTDLTTMIEGLGRNCSRLQNIHIAALRLSHAAVLALTAAQLRGLRMLSLVLGSEITDASVAAIASSYPNLELLDLSGSGISDSGIGIICNVFPETLSRLLLALCPNVTSSGIQFATAQLPLLELMDCGMTICDPDSLNPTTDEDNCKPQETSSTNMHLTNQKLIIKHSHLKKLSLWGCSGLDALYLNCPQLNDLNLNSCRNLHPERLLLQCPTLENVHASGCKDMLIGAIQSQVCNAFTAMENQSPSKRLPDGSKRVRVPYLLEDECPEPDKKRRKIERRLCNVLVN